MKKNIYNLLGFLFLICMCGACKSIPAYELKTTEENSESLKTEIVYPVFADFPAVNEQIQTLIEDWQSKCAHIQSEWTEYDVFHRENSPESETPPFGYSIVADSVIANDKYISILFRFWCFEGGAHGNTNLSSLTYNIKADKFVSIEDVSLYSLQELSTICYDSLCKQITGSEDFLDWIASGTSVESIENFSRFTFDGQTLSIYFDPYQVGPWAIGIQSVRLPVKETNSFKKMR